MLRDLKTKEYVYEEKNDYLRLFTEPLCLLADNEIYHLFRNFQESAKNTTESQERLKYWV